MGSGSKESPLPLAIYEEKQRKQKGREKKSLWITAMDSPNKKGSWDLRLETREVRPNTRGDGDGDGDGDGVGWQRGRGIFFLFYFFLKKMYRIEQELSF